MQKKVKIFLSIAVIAGIIAAIYYITIPKITIDEKHIRLDLYDYEITKEDVELFNNATEEDWEGMSEVPTRNKISEESIGGKLFEVIYRVHLDRKSDRDKFEVSANYELDPKLDNIIIAKWVEAGDVFNAMDGLEGDAFVSLTGVMPEYNEDELKEMVSKTKLTVYVQNQSNKKVEEFTVDCSDINIDIERYSEDEMYTFLDGLKENDD